MLNILAMAASQAKPSGIQVDGPGRSTPADLVVSLIPQPVAHFLGDWGLVWMILMQITLLVIVLKYEPKDANDA